VWGREANGITLTFHLAGINNQNFLMRDDQTGTYWQQISGRAISGPLAGSQLRLIHSDELTLALWKAEQPQGTVLKDVATYSSQYAPEDWDVKMKKAPTVLSYAGSGLAPRELMLGVHAGGGARAFRFDDVVKERLVEDRVGSEPVLLVVGADGESVRAFSRRLPNGTAVADFYRAVDQTNGAALMMDALTGSRWNFRGCAVEGPRSGECLAKVEVIKDYWFDWRNYNPATTVFRRQ
jgi:hypothetical protein